MMQAPTLQTIQAEQTLSAIKNYWEPENMLKTRFPLKSKMTQMLLGL